MKKLTKAQQEANNAVADAPVSDKRRPDVSCEMDVASRTLKWTFGDGTVRIVDLNDYTPDLRIMFELHGAKQKIGDAAALGMITGEDGSVRRPTVAEKRDAIDAMIAQLRGGDWNAKREGGETGGLLWAAMQRLLPGKWADLAAFNEYLDAQAAKSAEKSGRPCTRKNAAAALQASEKVRDMIATINAERGKATGVDTGDMIADLGL